MTRLAAAAMAATALAAAAGCGGDSESPTAAAPSTTPKQVTTVPEDGRLTSTTGTVVTDKGDRAQRVAAVRALDQAQRDFRAGRMAAACKRISDFLLNQFAPPGTRDDSPCPEKLEAYARLRARRGDRPVRLRLLWVRYYPGQAGVWVEEASGKRLRIQLSDPLSADEGWQFELGAHRRPDLLAAELVGAGEYGER